MLRYGGYEMIRFIVWNESRTEGFVTTDEQLAYEVRKSSDTNCFDSEGRFSQVGAAFCKAWADDHCAIEIFETVFPEGR